MEFLSVVLDSDVSKSLSGELSVVESACSFEIPVNIVSGLPVSESDAWDLGIGVKFVQPDLEDPEWLINGEDASDLHANGEDVFEVSNEDTEANLNLPRPDPSSLDLEYLRRGFRQLEREEVDLAAKGGPRKSVYMDRWARNRFNDWRKVSGIDQEESIEDMFERSVSRLNELLSTFFLQVQRRDGRLYPGETLVNLLRAISRIIRARIELRGLQTSSHSDEFYILEDPRFKKTCVSCIVSAQHSSKAGIGRKRRVTPALTPQQDVAILAQAFMSRSDRRGCQLRLAFYVTHNFLCKSSIEDVQSL